MPGRRMQSAAVAAVLCLGVAMAASAAAPPSSEARWNDLSAKFRQYHSDHTNIFFHLITTPLGVLSVLSLLNKATNTRMLTIALAVMYCVSIMDKMPLHILATTAFVATGLACGAANTASLSYALHAMMFVVGYFGQDAAHFFTGEQTFQSTYQQDSNFLELLAEHTYFLLPLVFESTMPPTSAFAPATHAQQLLHLAPMFVMLGMYFVASTGALAFPWMFQQSKVCFPSQRSTSAHMTRTRARTHSNTFARTHTHDLRHTQKLSPSLTLRHIDTLVRRVCTRACTFCQTHERLSNDLSMHFRNMICVSTGLHRALARPTGPQGPRHDPCMGHFQGALDHDVVALVVSCTDAGHTGGAGPG